jgi:hypothetical protein
MLSEGDCKAWRPKLNPFHARNKAGMRLPVPYNEVRRLEIMRAFQLVERPLQEQYVNLVHLSMRFFNTEVSASLRRPRAEARCR